MFMMMKVNQSLFFVKYVKDISAEKVIRRDTSVDEPVNEQRGAVQCLVCQSGGRMAVHKCLPASSL